MYKREAMCNKTTRDAHSSVRLQAPASALVEGFVGRFSLGLGALLTETQF